MTDTCPVHFNTTKADRKRLKDGMPPPEPEPAPERIPRISRLMALAIHFDGLIHCGVVREPGTPSGRDAVTEREMRRVCNVPLWEKQQDVTKMRLNLSRYTD